MKILNYFSKKRDWTIIKNRTITIELIYRWFDIWIGIFIEPKSKTLYFFPIPLLGLKITKTQSI